MKVDKHADLLFRGREIDFEPVSGGSRGFKLVLDGKFSLYFYQDRGHFKYDGWSVGEFDASDITILDGLRRRNV